MIGNARNCQLLVKFVPFKYTLKKRKISIDRLRKSLDEILLSTGANESLLELIKSVSRQRNLTEYKLAYAKEALGANYTLKEIGRNIKISNAAIVDMLKRHNLLT